MFSTLRTRFGIPGVISVIALVFAMFGGAYAASKSSEGGKATASAKSKRGPRGPKGPKGNTGPAGPVGPKGDTGATGANGKDGANGQTGGPGKDGQSVTGTPIAAGGACGTGVTGVKYTLAATATNICNGKEGPAGEDGQTGFTETLPSGKTLKGAWSFVAEGGSRAFSSISFGIPVSPVPALVYVTEQNAAEEEIASKCPGTFPEPDAEPGYLCVYDGPAVGGEGQFDEFFTNFFLNEAGVTLSFREEGAGFQGLGQGSWAVTAE